MEKIFKSNTLKDPSLVIERGRGELEVIMANKNPKNLIESEYIEDTTLYGEFISSFDQWISPDNQRVRVRHLQNCTKKNK